MTGQLTCYSCGTIHAFVDRVGRREECLKCRADLHCCRNCRFYDPKAYNECREPTADVVREKEAGNFCDFFEPGGSGSAQSEREKLLAQAEALFGKKTGGS